MDQLAIELVVDDQKATVKLDNFGQKVTLLNDNINSVGGDKKFAGKISTDLDALSKRADATYKSFQQIAKVRLDGGQIGVFTREILTAQTRSRQLAADIVNIRKELSNPNRSSSISFLTTELKAAEKELDGLSRRLQTVRTPTTAPSKTNRTANFADGAADSLGIPLGAAAVGALAVGAGIGFAKESLEATKEAANSQLQLQAVAKETGLSYQNLTAQAKEFGRVNLLSNREANSTFAQIANFANAAGRSDKLEEFQKRFSDLAAAKGINASQLGDISRQLNALTDEATDKLLNANPSAFYDKFAKSLNKTAEQLTDAEKRAAIFDEVLKKGAIFDGSAEQRLNSATSAVDKLSQKYETLKESAGKALLPILEVAEKAASSFLSIDGAQKNFNSNDAGVVNSNRRFLQQQKVDEAVKTLREQDKAIREAINNPNASLQNFALQNFNLADNFFNPETRQKAINAAVDAATKTAEAYKNAFERNINDKNISSGLAELGQKEFYKNQGLYDNDTRRKLAEGFDQSVKDARKREADQTKTEADKIKQKLKEFEQNVEKGKTKVKELEKVSLSAFDNLFVKVNSNNPFVSLFSEADKSLRDLKENIKSLPPELQKVALEAQKKINFRQLLSANLENQLSSFDLRNEAQNFRSPFDIGKQKNDQDDFVKNFLQRNPNFLFLQGKNSLDEETRSSILKQFAPSGLNETPADRLNKTLEDKFNLLFKPGQTAEQQALGDKKFISLTNGVNPLDLSKPLRESAALVREREAIRQDRYQQDALSLYREQRDYQKQIAANTGKQNQIAEKGGTKAIELLVKDERAGGNIELQKAATSADTANAYDDGNSFYTNGSPFRLTGGTNR